VAFPAFGDPKRFSVQFFNDCVGGVAYGVAISIYCSGKFNALFPTMQFGDACSYSVCAIQFQDGTFTGGQPNNWYLFWVRPWDPANPNNTHAGTYTFAGGYFQIGPGGSPTGMCAGIVATDLTVS
jgi:hypothetical protein